ncbi:MAG: hypothetical protein HYT27_02985 [Parcubacteria group bacterium]|nr:hypothetical protein [Parcubacteria group bacterium]
MNLGIRFFVAVICGILAESLFATMTFAQETERGSIVVRADELLYPSVLKGNFLHSSFQTKIRMGPSVFADRARHAWPYCFTAEISKNKTTCTSYVLKTNTFSYSFTDNQTYPISYYLTGKFKNGWFEVKILYPEKWYESGWFTESLERGLIPKFGWVLGDFIDVNVFGEKAEQFNVFWETYRPIVPQEFMVIGDNVLARNGPHISAGTHIHNWACNSHHYYTNSRGETSKYCRYYETFRHGDKVTVSGKQGNYFRVTEIEGVSHEPIWIYHEFVKPLE